MIADVLEALVRYTQSKLTEYTKDVQDKTFAIACSALFREWKPGNYFAGDIRTDGKTPYECMIDHDSIVNPDWTIDVRSIWKPYHSRQKEWSLPFIQPTGAHDMYKSGEYCIFEGKTYMCIEGTNYSPSDYPQAWEEV